MKNVLKASLKFVMAFSLVMLANQHALRAETPTAKKDCAKTVESLVRAVDKIVSDDSKISDDIRVVLQPTKERGYSDYVVIVFHEDAMRPYNYDVRVQTDGCTLTTLSLAE